ncbi:MULTISPECIES: hypothetical protein [Streptomyces]|nr:MULTISPECIES: hypothetical protein [Streptomyces]MBC2874772.1 hypothetical protein [Streptomyces sp. TYQ1024]UBI37224.1 hypothetical protein K7I03_12630 [Streptomyces mobaraensis]UKW29816.1 hypothetical protein MCU78_12605 [Streptomyces sp. TYQ1024]
METVEAMEVVEAREIVEATEATRSLDAAASTANGRVRVPADAADSGRGR